LQCVAVCCSVLQCVAVCCSVLQCVAVCCSVLQCVARRILATSEEVYYAPSPMSSEYLRSPVYDVPSCHRREPRPCISPPCHSPSYSLRISCISACVYQYMCISVNICKSVYIDIYVYTSIYISQSALPLCLRFTTHIMHMEWLR